MLKIECQEHLDAVRKFAEEEGKLDQLQNKLDYLSTYGQSEKIRVRLMKDFAEHSFYFHIERYGTSTDEWLLWMNGGLIYHQSSGEWSVHT
ncbi:hypothetical protein LCGC14_0672780 [marine sediment metagenome]|uniref:Uncharacterized protein n=1 Tax=marine sediment metagenome TaxID=412755 RepID=A0A0F9TYG6_9ZZZZ